MRLDMSKAAKTIIEQCIRAQPGEKILVVSDDTQTPDVYMALTGAAATVGAEVTLLLYPTPSTTIPGDRINVPQAVLAAGKQADAIILCGWRLPSWDAYNLVDQHQSPARVLMMTGLTEEALIRTTEPSMDAMERTMAELVEVFSRTRQVRVTCPLGTNITMDVTGSPNQVATGRFGSRDARLVAPHGGGIEYLPAGRIGVFTGPGRINGVLYFQSFLGLGLTPGAVRVQVDDSRVTRVDGCGADGWYVDALRQLFAMDENANFCCEVGIGTNPAARLTGCYEDYGAQGPVRFGFGKNHRAGIFSRFHSDSFTLGATMTLDGKPLITDGTLDPQSVLG